MPEFRRSLVTSFFFKYYLSVQSRLEGEPLPNELISATQLYEREPVKSTQGFQTVPEDQLSQDKVGHPMMHLSALQQASGEARYNLHFWKIFDRQMKSLRGRRNKVSKREQNSLQKIMFSARV